MIDSPLSSSDTFVLEENGDMCSDEERDLVIVQTHCNITNFYSPIAASS